MSEQPEALRLADIFQSDFDPDWMYEFGYEQAATELRRLHVENEALKTVMVAAAEEISSHWDAHCDSEGYGPVNLMRRLEQGIPSQYGYTAGEFERLRALNAAYAVGAAADKTLLKQALEALEYAADNIYPQESDIPDECPCPICEAIEAIETRLRETNEPR